ncbi:MAG: GNAT family N-acetyltransferase [Candidatus Odinarchaeota archaeon]
MEAREMMELREYQPSDIKGIIILHDEFMREYFSEFYTDKHRITQDKPGQQVSELEDTHNSYIQEGGKFWVIESKGKIIGLVGIRIVDENTAELINMRVKKDYRGQGLGKKLLAKAEKYCRNTGRQKIILHTAKRLVIARKMYESYGFKLNNEQVVSGNFTVLSYIKDLDD